VPVPIIAVGRIKTPEHAEKILAAGKADFIALGRALLADPRWVQKTFSGNAADIRPCIGCNQGCIDLLNDGGEVACTVNPWVGRELYLTFNKVQTRDKVVVIGGGPAGLNAAWVLAGRNYQVTLVEEQDELGGQMNLAAIPPGKGEFREAINYFVRKVHKAGVEIILGKRADVSLLRSLSPGKVIIATGARPVTPKINGIETVSPLQAWEVLKQGKVDGRRVIIIGGGAVGIETAKFLDALGKDVTVIEMLPFWGKGMGNISRWYVKKKREKREINFQIFTSTKVVSVNPSKITLERENKMFVLEGIDSIVCAVGACPENALSKDLTENLMIPSFLIGDAKEPRTSLEAIWEGGDIGLRC